MLGTSDTVQAILVAVFHTYPFNAETFMHQRVWHVNIYNYHSSYSTVMRKK
jgi:hypothetical protein